MCFHAPSFFQKQAEVENCPSCIVTMERIKPRNIVIQAFHVIHQSEAWKSYVNLPDPKHRVHAVQQSQDIHHPVLVLRVNALTKE